MIALFFIFLTMSAFMASMEPSMLMCARDYQEIKTLIEQENFAALSDKVYLLDSVGNTIPQELVMLSETHYETKKREYEKLPTDTAKSLAIINACSIVSFLKMEQAAHSLRQPLLIPKA